MPTCVSGKRTAGSAWVDDARWDAFNRKRDGDALEQHG